MFVLNISNLYSGDDQTVLQHGLCTFILESYEQIVHTCCQFLYESGNNEDRYKMLAHYNQLVEPLQTSGGIISKENRSLISIINMNEKTVEYYNLHEIVPAPLYIDYCEFRNEQKELQKNEQSYVPMIDGEQKVIRLYNHIYERFPFSKTGPYTPMIPQGVENLNPLPSLPQVEFVPQEPISTQK